LVRLVAEPDKMPDALGHQGQRGILRSMSTRAAFLADPTHRIVFHSTPKHASWMNQIALWFRMLVRKRLKRASCTSVEDLPARVLAFVEYCNTTMAKPFRLLLDSRVVEVPMASTPIVVIQPSWNTLFFNQETLLLDSGVLRSRVVREG
jgi:hypothetical protein